MRRIQSPERSASRNGKRSPQRTNVVVDMDLVERAKRKLRVRTTREAIQGALEALVRPVDYTELLAAYGSNGIAQDYDPKALYGVRTPPE